jgi:hypothetical protein
VALEDAVTAVEPKQDISGHQADLTTLTSSFAHPRRDQMKGSAVHGGRLMQDLDVPSVSRMTPRPHEAAPRR